MNDLYILDGHPDWPIDVAERLRVFAVGEPTTLTKADVSDIAFAAGTLFGVYSELKRLRKLVVQGNAVVNDFLPNVGHCVLQDFGRLNTFLIDSEKEKSKL